MILLRSNLSRTRVLRLLQYALNSVLATAADFTIFFLLTHYTNVEIMLSTILGNAAGAIVSFFLLYHWVFRDHSTKKWHRYMPRFAFGVAVCTVSNSLLTGFLHYSFQLEPVLARIAAAILTWMLGYQLNKQIFVKKAPAA
jgi:putative flippase GtrA